MKRNKWFTVVASGTAVVLFGAFMLSTSLAKTNNSAAKTQAPVSQVGSPQDDPGMNPGMGGQGMNPGMGGQGMNPGMGGQGMGPGMGGQGMMPGMGQGMMPGMGMGQGMMPGMGMGPTPVMVATNDYVYVLRGNTLYQFSAKDLKQLNKVTLEDEGPGMRMQRPMGQQNGMGGNLPQRPMGQQNGAGKQPQRPN